jgi:NTP pyrophosphatase (non-canonical NTP hydrolase)
MAFKFEGVKRPYSFIEYQSQTGKTAIYPEIGHNVVYPALGLANEAGEVLGKIKKAFRDDGGEFTEERLKALSGEIGDVLWYISQVATELGLSLSEIAEENVEKLLSRKERGKLQGEGDNR